MFLAAFLFCSVVDFGNVYVIGLLFAYSSALKMGAVISAKKSVKFYQTT
jgi:hypothetical protein